MPTSPIRSYKTIFLTVFLLLGFGITPTFITNKFIYLVYRCPSIIVSSLKFPPPAPQSLKAAILNVTGDFNELSFLIQDFLRSPTLDPEIEIMFKQYLAQRATRSHPGLESALDWVLALYKFAFPFVLISLLAKLTGGKSIEDEGIPSSANRKMSAIQPSSHTTIPAFHGGVHNHGSTTTTITSSSMIHTKAAAKGSFASITNIQQQKKNTSNQKVHGSWAEENLLAPPKGAVIPKHSSMNTSSSNAKPVLNTSSNLNQILPMTPQERPPSRFKQAVPKLNL